MPEPQQKSLPALPATFGREVISHPMSHQVALMIKTFPPQGESAESHWLLPAEDPHIHLLVASRRAR